MQVTSVYVIQVKGSSSITVALRPIFVNNPLYNTPFNPRIFLMKRGASMYRFTTAGHVVSSVPNQSVMKHRSVLHESRCRATHSAAAKNLIQVVGML